MFSMAYTTPEAVFRQLDKAVPVSVDSAYVNEYADALALIKTYCVQASDMISRWTSTRFVPYRYTYQYYTYDEILRNTASRGVMTLPDFCLQIEDVKQNSVVVNASQYRLNPVYFTPPLLLRFLPTFNPFFSFSADTLIEITAMWGYVTNYAHAFTAIETIAGSVTANQTSLVVVNASLYETFQYLQFENELVQITSIAPLTNTLTLQRGVNGTIAVVHSAFEIKLFAPDASLALTATKLVAYLYQHRNDIGNGATQFADASSEINMPPFVKDLVDSFRMANISAV